jgi:porphobilinogen deaminase
MLNLKALSNIIDPEDKFWLDHIETCFLPNYSVAWNIPDDISLESQMSYIQKEAYHLLVVKLSDLPINLPDKVKIIALSPRKITHEQIWCNPNAIDFEMDYRLKKNTKIYIQDQRQQYQISSLRPDLEIVSSKTDSEAYISSDKELDQNKINITLNPKEFLPVAGSGTLAVVMHEEDTALINLVKKAHHSETAILTNIERKVVKLNRSHELNILGVYCYKAPDQSFHVLASGLANGQLLKTRLSQTTSHGLAEKVLESFYSQIN